MIMNNTVIENNYFIEQWLMLFLNANLISITGFSKDPKDYFYIVAKGVGIEWTALAHRLNPKIDVDAISANYSKTFDRAMAALRKWYNMEGSKATTVRLLHALKDIERNDLIEEILH